MGLNMSHYLFLEGANNQFKIPDYNPIYKLSYYEQSYIMEVCNSYREEINSIKLELTDIVSGQYVLTEGERLDKVVKIVSKLWDNLIKLVRTIAKIITQSIINFITKLKKSAKDNPNFSRLGLPQKSDYYRILSLALSTTERYVINTADINPTDSLIDVNFPVAKLSTMRNMEFVIDDLATMARNLEHVQRDDIEYFGKAVDYINLKSIGGISDESAKELFGPYYDMYNGSDMLMSVVDAINQKAFGSDSVLPKEITMDLYAQAKENSNLGYRVIDDLTKIKREVESGYNQIVQMLNDISRSSTSIFTGHRYAGGPYKDQNELMRNVMSYINACSNTVQDILYAHSAMYTYKLKRLNQLYGFNNYSDAIIKECDRIVMEYIKKNESTVSDMTYSQYLLMEANLSSKERNGLPDSDFGLPKQRRYPMPDKAHVLAAIRMFNHVEKEYEAELAKNIIKKIKQFDMASEVNVGKNNRFLPYWEKSGLSTDKKSVKENTLSVKIDHNTDDMSAIVEEFNKYIQLANQLYIEEEFSYVINSILEADDNNQNNTQTNTTTQQTTTTNANNNVPKSNAVRNVVSNIIKRMADVFKRFTDVISKSTTLNAAWWKLNKDKVSSLDISKVKVNDWYDYNTDALSKSFTVEFDLNQPYMNSDQEFQNAIIQKIGGTVSVPEDSSFTEKVKSLFRVDHINMENSDGVPFGGTKTNRESMTKYIDDFQKGFNGGILKTLKNDIDKINAAQKVIQREYDNAVRQAQSTTGQQTTTTTQTTTSTTQQSGGTNNTNNNQQTQTQNADFRFDLAGTLGLMEHKSLKNIFEAKFAVNDELKQQVAATGGDAHKAIDDKIKRWFNYSSQAAGAKMTEAVAAYNQYIQLYKAVLGTPKNDNQQNNNQQQQQNQNQ